MDNRPIGIFDSGMGGLSVLKQALKMLPSEHFIYYADHANMPYGEKSPEQIKNLAFECATFLTKKEVKAIVVACNTATSVAIDDIRDYFDLPVISMEPAIKPGLEYLDSTGEEDARLLMLATPNTCRLDRYLALKARLDTKNRVIDVPVPDLASIIEKNRIIRLNYILDKAVYKYYDMNIHAVVLGCTHYPLIQPQIEVWFWNKFKNKCTFFEGSKGTVRQLERVLLLNELECDAEKEGGYTLFAGESDGVYLNKMEDMMEIISTF